VPPDQGKTRFKIRRANGGMTPNGMFARADPGP